MPLNSLSEAELAELAWSTYGDIYCNLAATVISAYDIFITFDREVVCIWERKVSIVTVVFICMRYGTFMELILSAVNGLQPGIPMPCQVVAFMLYALSVIVLSSHAVFSSLRIWAIWGRHWLILVVILPISLFPAAANLYNYALQRLDPMTSTLPLPLGGCWFTSLMSDSTRLSLSITTRASAIVADAGILVATWMKTWSNRQELKRSMVHGGSLGISLSGLILRDGGWYFAALLCLNIVVLFFHIWGANGSNDFASEFIDPVTSVLLCRLILNLRSFDLSDDAASSRNKKTRSLRFANAALDNIGASISSGSYHAEKFEIAEGTGNATLDKVMRNPLVVGLEEDIRCTEDAIA